jgi:hypothetical protein
MADVIMCAGYDCTVDFNTRTSSVLSRAEQQLREVAHLVFELNETVGQKISAGRMVCWTVTSDESFEPSDMEVVSEGSESTASSGLDGKREELRVICTTSLGLKRVVGGTNTVLVKPRVVLDSIFGR